MDPKGHFLYRGTTPGWRGSEGLWISRMTCTSTDPLVATLFAIGCRNHGPGRILLAQREPLEYLVGPSNALGALESAINLRMFPEEFVEMASLVVDVELSIEILGELGFGNLPPRLNGGDALKIALEASRDLQQRLSPEQLRTYNRRVFEEAKP